MEVERPRRKKAAVRKASPPPAAPPAAVEEQPAPAAAAAETEPPQPMEAEIVPDVASAAQPPQPQQATGDFSALRRLAAEAAPASAAAAAKSADSSLRYPALAVIAPTAEDDGRGSKEGAAVRYPELSAITAAADAALPKPEPLPAEATATATATAAIAMEDEDERPWQDVPGDLEASRFYALVLAYRAAQVALGELASDLDGLTRRAAKSSQEDVWRFEQKRLMSAANCSCGTSVQTTFEFSTASVDSAALAKLRELLAGLRVSSGQTLPLRVFDALMAKTRVRLYADRFISESQSFSNVGGEDPVVAVVPSLQTQQAREEMGHLQHMLSVLFFFERNRPDSVQPEKVPAPAPHQTLEIFHSDVRHWILALGALLLRRASFQDHLFLLQHLLCCPGVAVWGAGLLQFPTLWNSSFVAEHFVSTVGVFVHPISRSVQKSGQEPARVELKDWQVVVPDGGSSSSVDLPQKRSFQILEDDFLALFEQLPFGAFCAYLLQNRGVYQTGPSNTTLLSDLLGILSGALGKVAVYRTFAKRLTNLLASLLAFAAASKPRHPGAGAYSLGFNVSQEQFDAVFLLTAEAIIAVKQESSLWQFLSDLPFASLSTEAAWKFVGLVHFVPRARLPQSREEWVHIKTTAQPPPLSSLGEVCATENGAFIAQSLAAVGRAHGAEIAMAAADSLFHAALVDRRSRALSFKSTCGLLAAMCDNNAPLVSHIFELLDARLDEGDVHAKAGQHLISALPLDTWMPTLSDIQNVSSWLLADIGSPKHVAARSVLDCANLSPDHWDIAAHRRIAFILLRAWQHHVSESAKLWVFSVAAKTAFTDFSSWCWRRLCSLHYFQTGQADPAIDDAAITGSAMEHINGIFAGTVSIKFSQPMLVFAACVLSPFGVDPQSWTASSQPILTLLRHLLHHRQEAAAALVIQQLLPKIAETAHGSLPGVMTPAFLAIVRELVAFAPDQTFLSFLWGRGAASSAGALVRDIIHSHMSLQPLLASQLAEFWLQLAASQRQTAPWLPDVACHKIAASVLESWFFFQNNRAIPAPELLPILQSLLPKPDAGKLSVLPPKPVVTTFLGIQLQSFKEVPWLSYAILFAETCADTPQRQALASQRSEPKTELLKVTQWAHYALSLDATCELAPLFWQAFVHLYFDFSTGLRPFRFRSREIQEIQKAASAHLTALGRSIIAQSDGDSTRQTVAQFFLAASSALSIKIAAVSGISELLGLLPPDVARNEIFVHCVSSSPFSDPGNVWAGFVLAKAPKFNTPIAVRACAKSRAQASRRVPGVMSTEDALRRISATMPIRPESPVVSLPVVLPLPLDEDIVLPSLSEDLSVLNREATKHANRVSSIDRLDNEYFSLLPNMYSNVSEVSRATRSCTSCGKPVHFVVQITRAVQDHNLLQYVTKNRGDASKLVQERTIDIGICASFLQIEDIVARVLGSLQSEAVPADSIAARPANFKLACKLLYALSSAWENPLIQAFGPARGIFEISLTGLLAAVVLESADEAMSFLRTLLANPSRASSLARFFSPAQNAFAFAAMLHETLTSFATSGPNRRLVLPLLERFNVAEWALHASADDRRSVVGDICDGIRAARDESRALSFTLAGFSSVLSPDFPLLLETAVAALLKASASQELPAQAWAELLNLSFGGVSPELAIRVLRLISSELRRIRAQRRAPLYNLWMPYFSHFLALVSALLRAVLPKLQAASESHEPKELLRAFLDVHEPWIAQHPEAGQPWGATQGESGMAAAVLSSLLATVGALQPFVPSAMTLVWDFLTTGPAAVVCGRGMRGRQPPAAFVRELVLDSAVGFPWRFWRPDAPALAEALIALQAASVASPSSPALFRLFARLAVSVEWGSAVPEIARPDVFGMLFQCLLLTARGHPQPLPADLALAVATVAETIDWRFVAPDAIMAALTEFLESFARVSKQAQQQDPEWSPRWVLVFRVAAAACGMLIRPQPQPGVFASFITPFCGPERLTSLARFHVALCPSSPNLMPGLTGMIVRAARELALRDGSQCFAPPVQVLFTLFNIPGEPAVSIASEMNALSREQPAAAPLLVAIACRTIAAPSKLAVSVEGFIEAHFVLSRDWQIIVDSLSAPQIDEAEFISHCLDGGSFLTLFALAQKRVAGSTTSGAAAAAAETASWLSRVRLPQGREHLLLLLLSVHLDLNGTLASQSTNTLAATIARREALGGLAASLQHLGEDRKGDGIVGFLGIGERSQFSPAFRLAMRVVSAFIYAQAPEGTNVIRVRPEDPHGTVSPHAQKVLLSLTAAAKSREYTGAISEQVLESVIRMASEAVNSPSWTLLFSRQLLGQLSALLFPQSLALSVLSQLPGEWGGQQRH